MTEGGLQSVWRRSLYPWTPLLVNFLKRICKHLHTSSLQRIVYTWSFMKWVASVVCREAKFESWISPVSQFFEANLKTPFILNLFDLSFIPDLSWSDINESLSYRALFWHRALFLYIALFLTVLQGSFSKENWRFKIVFGTRSDMTWHWWVSFVNLLSVIYGVATVSRID